MSWRSLLPMLAALLAAVTSAHAEDELQLERHRGKVVIVDFWASWCGPCRQSFPWLNAMQAKYAERGLVVIGVNVDRERGEAERFLREVPARFELLFDSQGKLAEAYEVPGMPSTYVFGPDGQLIAKHIGFRLKDQASREEEIQQLLTGPSRTSVARTPKSKGKP